MSRARIPFLHQLMDFVETAPEEMVSEALATARLRYKIRLQATAPEITLTPRRRGRGKGKKGLLVQGELPIV